MPDTESGCEDTHITNVSIGSPSLCSQPQEPRKNMPGVGLELAGPVTAAHELHFEEWLLKNKEELVGKSDKKLGSRHPNHLGV